MLTRRTARALRSFTCPSPPAFTLTRTFASSLSQRDPSKAPALADITSDGGSRFDARQKEFRDQVAANQRRKEQEEKDARARESAQDGKKSGPLSSLFYGTEAGRNMDKEMERSFSQVLARGKYVHTIVFHEVKPDKVDEYVDLVGMWYPKISTIPENKVNLVGSWRTEVGDCDTFVHIWEYQRYTGYHNSLYATHHHPDYPGYEAKLKPLIHSKRTSLMQEFSFWPTTPPRQLGGLFELRSYTLHPGNLLEWETHWRRGLKARREVMEGVGAWFVQIGDLNTVHHLWQFANLEERKVRREQSWSIEGWGETVHKTVPLIQTMKSRILVPMPWSPVA
ncbi:NIPSNAP-domain-containing protein [Rhizodiscina lignyota]|uniref:NIPSNAP-domain-containing protein n=1 Tax=Rhizodiscina lignyota TaxID=1504668 RepID=A0A9P4ITF4_9PEZI|nr:NIPSNAP-domain-containing protein [Rhizodiscina lignyota]